MYFELKENKPHGTKDDPFSTYHIQNGGQSFQIPVHWHDELEIIYVKSGFLTVKMCIRDSYGICKDDMESRKPWPDGFIVRELSRNYSNFRADISIQQFLEENGVPGIAGIDTRALTKILREKGTMNGMITTNANYNFDEILPSLKAYTTGKVVEKVTCDHVYEVKGSQSLTAVSYTHLDVYKRQPICTECI